MAHKLIAAVFVLLPLAYLPRIAVPYEGAKAYLLYAATVAALVLVYFSKSFYAAAPFKKHYHFFIFFLLWAFGASTLAGNLAKSLFGNYYRYDGLVTLLFLLILSICVSSFVRSLKVDKLSKSIRSGVLIAIAVSLLGFPTFGNNNLLAGYLVVTTPFCIESFKKLYSKTLYIIVLIGLAVVWASNALLLGVIIYLALQWLYSIHAPKRIAIYLGIAFLVFLALYLIYIFSDSDAQFIAQSRERITRRLFAAFLRKPFTGWGWANIDEATLSNNWPIQIYADVYVDKAHNLLLEVLVSTGIIGLLSYSVFVLKLVSSTIKRLKYKSNPVLLSCVILYLFQAQVNVLSIATEVVFWFSVGVLVANLKEVDRNL